MSKHPHMSLVRLWSVDCGVVTDSSGRAKDEPLRLKMSLLHNSS